MPKSLAEGTSPIPGGTSSTIGQSPNERLDSWKEIAVYFRRDVRTVRRWEQSLGLPVHRHRQRRGVAVYAYKSEVDEWWRGRDQKVEPAPASVHGRRPWLPLVWAAAASLGALGILLGIWRQPPAPASSERSR